MLLTPDALRKGKPFQVLHRGSVSETFYYHSSWGFICIGGKAHAKTGCEFVSYWLCSLPPCVDIQVCAKGRFDIHLFQQPVPFSSPSPDHPAASDISPLGILAQLFVTLWGELIWNNNSHFWRGYFKPVPIPWGSSRHGCKNIYASTAEEEVKE